MKTDKGGYLDLSQYATVEVDYWRQDSIDSALAAYYAAISGKEILFEQLCRLLKDEIMRNLKHELKDDVAIEEAEYVAVRELSYRLRRGKIKFLSKTYLKRFVCGTAIRFVRKRRGRVFSIDELSQAGGEIPATDEPLGEKSWFRYADLYFCIKKLTGNEKVLLELHHYEDMPLEKAAVSLGIKHEAARQRHSRTLKKLRLCLESLISGGKFNA